MHRLPPPLRPLRVRHYEWTDRERRRPGTWSAKWTPGTLGRASNRTSPHKRRSSAPNIVHIVHSHWQPPPRCTSDFGSSEFESDDFSIGRRQLTHHRGSCFRMRAPPREPPTMRGSVAEATKERQDGSSTDGIVTRRVVTDHEKPRTTSPATRPAPSYV